MKKAIKTLLCIILALSLFLHSTAFAAIRTEERALSFFVASDIHYRPQSALVPINEQNTLPGDPLYSHTNTKSMLTYEADAIIDEFLKRFEASDSKYLLIPGDISEDGFWEEHLAIAQKLRDFQSRTGKKIYLIPGNHDIRTSASRNRLNLSDFLDVYADIGFDETLARHEGTASYTVDLDGSYRLIAIDACIYREDGSRVSDDLLSWIEAQVLQARQDNKKLIGMVHHNVLEHFGIESIGGNMLCLDGYRDMASMLADWGIKYVFTGHEHANDISTAVSKKGNRIFDVETGCLIAYPNAFRVVSFSDEAVDIKTEYVDKVDISLLPEGCNQAQLALIQSDFPAYSLGYFKAGIKSYAYELPKATGKLAEKLKIEEGTKEYEALIETIETLSEALRLPLYDENETPETDSVAEIAAKAGITLDLSNYSSVLDVAAGIYAGHYAGDENLSFSSPEVRLLGQGLNAVLYYALTNIPVRTANILLSELGLPENGFSLNDSFLNLTAKTIYMKTAAKVIFNAMIKPLADGIINDWSAPADLNVTLEPYGASQPLTGQTVAVTDIAYILRIILRVLGAMFSAFKTLTGF